MNFVRGLFVLVVLVGNSRGDDILDWFLGLYNPHTLPIFAADGKNVSIACATDMNEYLVALHQQQIWAAKMMDASGRYTSQFFYGNNFWLGSLSLCHELSNSHITSGTPKFPISFSVARLLIKMENITNSQGQLIFLGLCLPVSCTGEDIRFILTQSYNSSTSRGEGSVSVLRVRPVPGDYVLVEDKKFLALGGSILVVTFFIIIGSLYECVLKSRKKQKIITKSNGSESKTEEAHCDVENNNLNKKSSFKYKSKANVYEVNRDKKETEEKNEQGPTKKKEDKPKGFFSELLLSFSVFSNGGKILSCTRTSEDSLNSVHGLRFLSLMWVIMVHTYLQIFAIGENKVLRAHTEKKFIYQTVGNATYSVDSFFLISGLLVSYLYFKNESEQKNKVEGLRVIGGKFMTLIIYRFIRLTPVYIVVLGLVHLTMTVLRNISVFETPLLVDLTCDSYWWRNILYINNFFPRKEMCMLWSWYMAADTQFFVLCSLLLLLSRRYFKFSTVTLFTLLISSWFTTAFISYTNQYKARVQEPFVLFDELYDKPWTRIGPYIVGMCAGWYLQRCGCKIKIPIIVVLLGWAASLACLCSLVYGIPYGLDVTMSTVYVSLGHTAWGLSLAWMVVACSCGYGGWVNTILSCRAFYPLSRLTYCAYLVHPVIMFLTNYVMDGSFHMHNGVVMIIFLGNAVASFILSFFLSLAFEAPFVRLLKLALSLGKKK